MDEWLRDGLPSVGEWVGGFVHLLFVCVCVRACVCVSVCVCLVICVLLVLRTGYCLVLFCQHVCMHIVCMHIRMICLLPDVLQ